MQHSGSPTRGRAAVPDAIVAINYDSARAFGETSDLPAGANFARVGGTSLTNHNRGLSGGGLRPGTTHGPGQRMRTARLNQARLRSTHHMNVLS